MTKSVQDFLNEFGFRGDPEDPANKYYKRNDRWKFALTFSHLLNRITTANVTASTLDNTKRALLKTVGDCNTMDDIHFLRRDAQVGLGGLARIVEKHPDPARRKECEEHMRWMRNEYREALLNRAREIKKIEKANASK
jgi:hypothetical protein